MKKNRGITLIALVITIIILLILAGVTINLIVGNNGVIAKANQSKISQEIATYKERIELIYASLSVEHIHKGERLQMETWIKKLEEESIAVIGKTSYQNDEKTIAVIETEEGYRYRLELNGEVTPIQEVLSKDIKIITTAKADQWEITLQNTNNEKISYRNIKQTQWNTVGTTFTIDKGGIYQIKITNRVGETYLENVYLYEPKGLQLYLDGSVEESKNNKIWKDLSQNTNDLQLNNFNEDATSGWQQNYLSFDGINDFGKTINVIDYKESKEITIELIDINRKLFEEKRTVCLYESSIDTNTYDGSYYVCYNQFRSGGMDFATKYGVRNIKTTPDIRMGDNLKCNSYTLALNKTKPYNQYMSAYINGESQMMQVLNNNYIGNIDDTIINNYHFYLGSRAGTEYFGMMNVGAVRIYNRELTEEEIKINQEIDQVKFGK